MWRCSHNDQTPALLHPDERLDPMGNLSADELTKLCMVSFGPESPVKRSVSG